MLYITLGGGFDDHRIALALDGKSIFDEEHVTSSPLLDLATELPPLRPSAARCHLAAVVTGPDGAEIDRAECSLFVSEDLYVVIYLERSGDAPGRLRISTSKRPFAFG